MEDSIIILGKLFSERPALDARLEVAAGGQDQRGEGPAKIRSSLQSNASGIFLIAFFHIKSFVLKNHHIC